MGGGWLHCEFKGCAGRFKSYGGRTHHVRSKHYISNIVQCSSLPLPLDATTSATHSDHDSDTSASHNQSQASHWDGAHYHNLDSGLDSEGDVPKFKTKKTFHPQLTGAPCNHNGDQLQPGSPPPPRDEPGDDDWTPFDCGTQFQIADLLFRKDEMSASNLDDLFTLLRRHSPPPATSDSDDSSMFADPQAGPLFKDHDDMYDTIDASKLGDAPWQCLKVDPGGTDKDPLWKQKIYEVWFRDPDIVLKNMLDNLDFDGEFDYSPYIELDDKNNRHWGDVMSANFAWRHATNIYNENPEQNQHAMYCPIILGSDKTTVSVATGQVEYHPLYLSIGNIWGSTHHAHRQGVIPIAFLAIPKAPTLPLIDLGNISSIKKYMTTPVVRRCPDGHFHRVIFDFGPFIGDYPEQVMLAAVVQGWCARCMAMCTELDNLAFAARREKEYTNTLISTFDPGILWDEYGVDDDIIPFTNDFPHADIHEMLSPDLLHQIIKGTFKDHLVTWVGEYLELTHGKTEAKRIMDEIDHRIAAAPSFPGLRRFPDGRRFKQWTGDDSKALMKVYLPALVGFVPSEIIKTFRNFLDFCYLVRRPVFTPQTLDQVNQSLAAFHESREVFRDLGVRPDGFSLPRQHSLIHYPHLIQEFGVPNGLCSSITESRHITAVKKPWRRSSRWNALGQMLTTNQRLDKLAAMRTDFETRGMLPISRDAVQKPVPPDPLDGSGEGCAPTDDFVEGNVTLARTRIRNYPRRIDLLAEHINVPELHELTRRFLYDYLYPDVHYSSNDIALNDCPDIHSKVAVYHSAIATFFAPSDMSGIRGMRCERIRSTPDWRGGGDRRDCAFVVEDQDRPGFEGMAVVRVLLLFSFKYDDTLIPCALVQWFKRYGQRPDADTGMWIVRPETTGQHDTPVLSVVHLDCMLRLAHLLPIFGPAYLPTPFSHLHTLDAFKAFYINRYIDHHAFEILL
ncbi:hypothetical protein CCMSSC00406_0008478 [Pleurotus cornucopiae]|uniref:Uncharacterized protein n=1 Tax=Pleurotus cornucopiae TaxID=5321 RepID=A0ACB7IKR8_PLECO|nr:hypothetical protein CCMSSC00406_0008478 [Pleurotus cornucopiae]